MIWSVTQGHHTYVLHNGKVIYKNWLNKDGSKKQPSLLMNNNGWPNEWVV